jgi:hypothetical protein
MNPIDDMPAGRDLDAMVAEYVMGITIHARDWPCGPDLECGGYQAARWWEIGPDGVEEMYPDRGPVYDDPRWPAAPDGHRMLFPVPFYSTDLVDAWAVVDKVRTWVRAAWLLSCEDDWQASVTQDRAIYGVHTGETAPLAICRAALHAAAGREQER